MQVKRRSLLRRYDDDALHQLRVALRRLRSQLRHIDTDEAKALRRELGQLAAATNPARDWDTLARRAQESLKPRDLQRVRPWLRENRAASHRQVLDMLRSQAWAQAVGRLEDWIGRAGLDPVLDPPGGEEIAHALREVRRAWDKARPGDDTRRWHKLRLAIKELRYTFDSVPRNSPAAPKPKTPRHCRQLQDLLGAWHDTVVHAHMVRAYASALDPEVDGKLQDALWDWCRRIEREGRDTLDETRDYLLGKGGDLLR